ncbi:adenylate/guanylate cyclase domain-containing protein, partial [Gemmatimonadota bacterium]
DSEIPTYYERVLRKVGLLLRNSATQPLFHNTWGDGLFLVFEKALEGARFALRLRDVISSGGQQGHGLERMLGLRMGLHTGPVFEAVNPVTGKNEFVGTHVTTAARIEPVAVPGQVLASQETAAIIALERNSDVSCHYVGEVDLPKGFGAHKVFGLEWKDGRRQPGATHIGS